MLEDQVMTQRILLVDDEPNVLNGYRRHLGRTYEVDFASRGNAALDLIRSQGPYAIVVSDLQMPEMDGVELLNRVQQITPETVRIMLTGKTDQETAVRAVNQGNIFRFLNKPCPIDYLSKAIEDALRQFEIVTAEKDLLQNTLTGSVKVLTDILSMIDPASFGRALKLREPIRNLAKQLQIRNAWDIELAAMLAEIGTVVLPPEVAARYHQGATLSAAEQELVDKIPVTGSKLLENIPRLSTVAKIVLYQNHNLHTGSETKKDEIPLGSRMIRVLRDLDQRSSNGTTKYDVLLEMSAEPTKYDQTLVTALKENHAPAILPSREEEPRTEILELGVEDLQEGQTVITDVLTTDKVLLITAGTVLTETLIERIKNYSTFVGINLPIKATQDTPFTH